METFSDYLGTKRGNLVLFHVHPTGIISDLHCSLRFWCKTGGLTFIHSNTQTLSRGKPWECPFPFSVQVAVIEMSSISTSLVLHVYRLTASSRNQII